MDKKSSFSQKSEKRWKLKQLRLRSAVFLRRNGLQVMVIGCLALLGATAVIIFTTNNGEEIPDSPANNSNDQRLEDVLNTVKPDPTPTNEPDPTLPLHTLVPNPTYNGSDNTTILPDFTAAPELTVEPSITVNFEPPVNGSVFRVFAINSLIYSETLKQWMTHSGVDVASPKGTEVHAIAAGTVEDVFVDDMLGVTVIISHENGLKSVYSNLAENPPVKIGDKIDSRAVIGCIGDTAIGECAERSHLHFETIVNGTHVDPEGLMVFKQENE